MTHNYALFVRVDKCNTKRGELAGVLNKYPSDDRRFIVCKVGESFTSGSLDLPSLMVKYPNTSKVAQDENGDDQTVITEGYFNVNGRSSESECPILTPEDVTNG